MPKKDSKVVEREPKLYALRLWITNDDQDQTRYIEVLDQWLQERPANMSAGARLNELFIALMDAHMESLGQTINPVMVEIHEMKRMIQQLLRNPGSIQRLAQAAESIEQGEDISPDILENMLEDFNS